MRIKTFSQINIQSVRLAIAVLVLAMVLIGFVHEHHLNGDVPTQSPERAQVTPSRASPQVQVAGTPEKKITETSSTPAVDSHNFSQPIQNSSELAKNVHGSSLLAARDYPQYEYKALNTPNDPYTGGAWYHSSIQSNRAWDLSMGSSNTVVAVIDTGFALAHQDLQNKWVINSGEQGQTSAGDVCWTGTPADKATNGCDDDQNHYIDDWRGWDFVSSDNNPQTGVTDPNGQGTQHATMVSSIIAATANNSIGITGIDWNAKIMPLQVLSDQGTGFTYDIVAAIQYATDNGANIINMSLGGSQYDQGVKDAVVYARDHGVLVVAASGNCGGGLTGDCTGFTAPGGMAYPGNYPEVLSVGATGVSDVRSSFSSYGPEVDITAPGEGVGPLASWSSSFTTNGYVSSADGTSFASPIVAGVAALIRSQLANPTVDQLRSTLLDSTDKVGGLHGARWNEQYGWGRINAHKATLLAEAMAHKPGTVGNVSIHNDQAPLAGIVRSTTGNMQSDEWLLVACRVSPSDVCTLNIHTGTDTGRINPVNRLKGEEIYYMFVKGSDLGLGSTSFSLHNANYGLYLPGVTR